MARQPENIGDGFFSLEGGMNSGVSPSLLPHNQCALTINRTMRGGFCRNRPRYRRITANFGSDQDAHDWFISHPISGQSSYQATSGQTFIVCCAGGRFFAFKITGKTAVAFEFTPPDSRNSLYQPITWFCQAANFLVAQNGLDIPVIFDGASGRRSNIIEDNEVPVGKQMAYINNRLFVVLPDGREIAPGDLAYSTPTSVITFTEINQPTSQGGQPLAIPLELGGITGLAVTSQTDTETGQGTLLVATNRAICSINPIVQRNLWPTIQLQNIALVGNGFTSNGLGIVNGDVWGRSVDGFRSFIMARRDFASWGNTPQSREVERILQYDDRALLSFANLTYFDNRLLMTVSPQAIGNGLGCYHNGMIALNFDNISSLTTKSPPAYDGLWTGIHPYGFCQGNINGEQRCFMFSYFPHTQTNELWEVTTEYGDDDDAVRIEGTLESRSLDFQSKYVAKELMAAEIYADQIYGQVDFTLSYKPDQYPCWIPWKTWSQCAGKTDCEAIGELNGICNLPSFTELQYFPHMEVGPPPNICDPVSKLIFSRGYEFQVKLDWKGNARVRSILLFANKRLENNNVVGCRV